MEMNNKETRRVVIGITAHVDAGKTTLAEAMLYRTGQLRKLGRVDHGSAAMDSHLLERERGITIFLSQAELPLGDMEVTLLDTPGHVDFSAEMERTLSVLDYAILVISGADGVQAHTRTLWRLLEQHPEASAVAIGNLGHLPIVRGLNRTLRGDFGLNIFNSRALLFWQGQELASATVSFELRWQQVRDLRKYLPCEAIIYGRLPLMVTENCVTRCSVGCTHGAGSVLTDRTGARFPVLCGYGCRCEIQNSKTLFLADKPEMRRCGLTYGRLRFTTETPEQCVQVLQRYQNGGSWAPEDLTRGLFYRGVE